jgi:hypothetical protein
MGNEEKVRLPIENICKYSFDTLNFVTIPYQINILNKKKFVSDFET